MSFGAPRIADLLQGLAVIVAPINSLLTAPPNHVTDLRFVFIWHRANERLIEPTGTVLAHDAVAHTSSALRAEVVRCFLNDGSAASHSDSPRPTRRVFNRARAIDTGAGVIFALEDALPDGAENKAKADEEWCGDENLAHVSALTFELLMNAVALGKDRAGNMALNDAERVYGAGKKAVLRRFGASIVDGDVCFSFDVARDFHITHLVAS